MGIVIDSGLGGGGQNLAGVVPAFLAAQEDERRYQLAKQRAMLQEAAQKQEMSQSAEAFGWEREQRARLKAIQGNAMGVGGPGFMAEGSGGAQGPPTPLPEGAQGPPTPMSAGPEQAIGGSDSDFEKMLQGQLATSQRVAQNLMALDPVRGAEYASRHLEESRQIFTQLALEHARTKALGDVSAEVAHGAYSVPLLSGQGEDPTFSMLAQSKLAQLQIPGTDPRPILSELGDLKERAHLQAYNNARLGTRMASAEQDVKKRIEEHKPADSDGVARLIDLAKRGAITPEQWDAQIEDAIHGRTDLKENYARLQAQLESANIELSRARAEKERALAGFNERRGSNLVLPGGPGKSLSLDRRYISAQKMAEQEFKDGQISRFQDKNALQEWNANHDDFVEQRIQAHLSAMGTSEGQPAPSSSGKAKPASDLIRDIRAGKLTDPNAIRSLMLQNGWVDEKGQPSMQAVEAQAGKEGP